MEDYGAYLLLSNWSCYSWRETTKSQPNVFSSFSLHLLLHVENCNTCDVKVWYTFWWYVWRARHTSVVCAGGGIQLWKRSSTSGSRWERHKQWKWSVLFYKLWFRSRFDSVQWSFWLVIFLTPHSVGLQLSYAQPKCNEWGKEIIWCLGESNRRLFAPFCTTASALFTIAINP